MRTDANRWVVTARLMFEEHADACRAMHVIETNAVGNALATELFVEEV